MPQRPAVSSRADRLPDLAGRNSRSANRKRTAWHPNAPGFTPTFSAERHIGTALRETYRAFARALSQNLAPLGLTLSMWFALRSLWEADGQSQAELGRRIELNPAAVVAVLKALEVAGLVERKRTRKDRRIYNVFLTATGRKLRTKATALALQVDARALRGVTHEEIDQALAILQRLRGNLANQSKTA
ncbi:MAG: MarR family transcriptional regulator [Xanthobacteraceae bacterium]|nr:MarR family transcriptional regulator [Xanthobacteraceae bacterium]